MAIYTLTINLIENFPSSDKESFGALFHVFTNIMSGHKLAIDANKKILSLYAEAKIDDRLKALYKEWLEYLADMLRFCESIQVEIDTRDKDVAFLQLASSINGEKNIIVYSRNNCKYNCDDNNDVEYDGKRIHVLDKDDAISEINIKYTGKVSIQQTMGDNSPVITGDQNKIKN